MRSVALVVCLVASACATTRVEERCRLITDAAAVPLLPSGFRAIDRALVQRTREMVGIARTLRSPIVYPFKELFAEDCIPELCGHLEAARSSVLAGRAREAGNRYQGLLVASQLLALRLAVMQVVDSADLAGQPSGQLETTVRMYEAEMLPLGRAALSGDPRQLRAAVEAAPIRIEHWLAYLTRWTAQVRLGEERVRIAKTVWDGVLLAAAAYDAAGAAADLAVGGGPPPALGALAGGAGALTLDRVAFAEALEALRRLIASGAFDGAIVAGIARMQGTGTGWSAVGNKSSEENARGHWTKHGAEFPQFKSLKEYVEGAWRFLNDPPPGALTKVRANGEVVVYDPATNTFGARGADGSPKTLFKPDPALHGRPSNMDYFRAQ